MGSTGGTTNEVEPYGRWLEPLSQSGILTQSCIPDDCSHHNLRCMANRSGRTKRNVRSKRAKKALLALLACRPQRTKKTRSAKRLHKTSHLQLDAEALDRHTLSAARQQASAVRRERRRDKKRQRSDKS